MSDQICAKQIRCIFCAIGFVVSPRGVGGILSVLDHKLLLSEA
jgi:hypothetical protein